MSQPAPAKAIGADDRLDQLANAQPFDSTQLWVIAFCAGLNVVFVETCKALFLDGQRRARARAADKLARVDGDQARKALEPAAWQADVDVLREDADNAAAAYNRSVGVLWLISLVVSAGFGLAFGLVFGWSAQVTTLAGFVGGAFAKPLEKYAEPLADRVLRRLGLRKPHDDDDDTPAPRSGTREKFRTATAFRKARDD